MIQTEIYEEFDKWLDTLLENNDMPENTRAFNFNLYDESDDAYDTAFGIQLIASDKFSEDDDDWACSEVWTSEEEVFYVDSSDETDKSRKNSQDCAKALISSYLEDGKYAHILRAAEAIGVGFVDGDIEILYKNEN